MSRPSKAQANIIARMRIDHGFAGVLHADEQLILAKAYLKRVEEVKRLKKQLKEAIEGFERYRNS